MPYDLAAEPSLPASPPRPLAFAVQKLAELAAAAAALRRWARQGACSWGGVAGLFVSGRPTHVSEGGHALAASGRLFYPTKEDPLMLFLSTTRLCCSGAEAPFAVDLATFTGAPAPTQRQLAPELFSRPLPYAERR